MSGSGGYYKYRCKYWLTYNCPHWVWINNTSCPHCLADGRESDGTMLPGQFGISREVYVPIFENGIIHYTIMEIVATSDFDSGWAVKALPIQTFPTTTGPSAVNLMAIDGLETQKRPNPGFQTQHADPAGNGGKANME